MAGPKPSKAAHKAPKCRLQICDAVTNKCSRVTLLQPVSFNDVSKTFTTSKTQSMVSVAVTVTCDLVTGEKGRENIVFVDQITLEQNWGGWIDRHILLEIFYFVNLR